MCPLRGQSLRGALQVKASVRRAHDRHPCTTMNRKDLDPLFDEAVKVAQFFLDKSGEFFPFAVTLSREGKQTHVQGWTGNEQPSSDEVISLLKGGFAQSVAHGELRATALVVDVRVSRDGHGPKTDAIRVTLEHEDGSAIHCFLPYAKSWLGKLKYGEVFASPTEASVFVKRDA